MDRKDFLNTLLAPKPKLVKPKPAPMAPQQEENPLYLQSGINPYAGTFTKNEVIHLLKRTMFGAVKEDVDYFSTLTSSQAVDQLLNTVNPNPGKPLKDYTSNTTSTLANDPDWGVAIGATWANAHTNSGGVNFSRRLALKNWWVGLMINQPRSVEEKMILFWSTLLPVEFDTVDSGRLNHQYLELLRTHAFGNYKTFIKALTLNPAMLVYLNGRYNTKTAPDENYGRELQELFTLGKGSGSQYTEADVKAAAKVLTGYTMNSTTLTSSFNSANHDITNKQFSSFYNNTIITGRTGATGAQELDDLLTMIFAQAEVAKYICRRLYNFFVYSTIDATTETNVIEPLADIFRNGNYEIKPVLNALFKSEHFFDPLVQGAIIKSPADFVLGMQREMKVAYPPAANIVLNYKMLSYIANTTMAAMDQNPGDPPNVSGWAAYYQAPQFDESWLSTDTYTKRRKFMETMVAGYSNTNQKLQINPIDVARRMSNPGDPNQLVQDFNTYFLRTQLETTTLEQIKKDTLLTGQTSDYYWTNAWDAYIANPNLQSTINDINNRLKSLCNYFLFLEEYHLM